MQEPEPLAAYESLLLSGENEYVPNRYAMNLKDGGVDLEELRRGGGASFEIDPDEQFPHGHNSDEEEPSNAYFDMEEMFHQLNHEVLGVDEDTCNETEISKTPFESMAQDMDDLTGDHGVLKKILRPGVGPVVPKTASVRFHYNAYNEYCDEPYDSSRFRGKPENTRLGGGAFLGIDIGLSTMRKGEMARFLFEKEYVFNEMGCAPRVPAGTVMWEVEVLGFVDHGPSDDISDLPKSGEKRKASFEHLLAVANGHKEFGNDLYKRKQVHQAVTKYMKAIRLLEECSLQNETEENHMNQVLLKLYSNMAQCALELGQSARAIKYARKVLYIDPKNVKALFRMGKAFMKESEFDRAREYFVRALQRQPNNKDIKAGMIELNKNVEKFKVLEKERCRGAMRDYLGLAADTKENKDKEPKFGDGIPQDVKQLMSKKLSDFKEDESVKEMVLPSTLTEKEMEFVQEVATGMGIKSEIKPFKGHQKRLRVWK